MTSFPTSAVTYSTLVDLVDSPTAAHENSQGDELTAIERFLLGNGAAYNRYKIAPSVSSNDLIVAVTHEDGSAPSATQPMYFKIGNTVRSATAALSVTKADGTNWANLGSAELGTKEADLFLYAVWNTNLTPDAVDIFWSRVPYGSVYSDFSSTTTSQYYAAVNGTAPAATDECVVIGRFAATLSLSGTSHLWTVPTYTNINLIHQPVYKTRWLSYTPTITGYSANPTNSIYEYYVDENIVKIMFSENTAGTSNATTKTYTMPFTSLATTYYQYNPALPGPTDNGTTVAAGFVYLANNANSMSFHKSTAANWTASGNCLMGRFMVEYRIK